METDTKKEPCGGKTQHEWYPRERYEYLKDTSRLIADTLAENKFGVTQQELGVFLSLLEIELRYKFRF